MSEYRALFVADVHLTNKAPFAVRDSQTLVTDRLGDISQVLSQMLAYADDQEISDIWILGDLLDSRLLDAVTLKVAFESISEIVKHGRRVILVPGNHEAHDSVCRHYTLDAFRSLEGVTVVGGDGMWYDVENGPRIFAMPYLPPNRASAALQAAVEDTDPAHLLLVHQTIQGAMQGGWSAPDGLDPVLLSEIPTLAGHFHTPQIITGASVPARASIAYLGAPLQHNFGDAGQDRGFHDIIVNSNRRPPTTTMVPIVGAPRFHDLLWETSGQFPDVDGILQGDYVNLRIRGPSAAVNKLKGEAEERAANLRQSGIRLIRVLPEPEAAPARQRILTPETGEPPTVEASLARYLDLADCTGLDRARLQALGQEIIADVER